MPKKRRRKNEWKDEERDATIKWSKLVTIVAWLGFSVVCLPESSEPPTDLQLFIPSQYIRYFYVMARNENLKRRARDSAPPYLVSIAVRWLWVQPTRQFLMPSKSVWIFFSLAVGRTRFIFILSVARASTHTHTPVHSLSVFCCNFILVRHLPHQ